MRRVRFVFLFLLHSYSEMFCYTLHHVADGGCLGGMESVPGTASDS